MVRIKNRYLLVNILYPDDSTNKPHLSATPVPAVVQFHKPSPNFLTPGLLAQGIRDQVELMYGEFGAGVTANGLNGMSGGELANFPP